MKGKTYSFTTCTSVLVKLELELVKSYTKGRTLMLNHVYQQSYP